MTRREVRGEHHTRRRVRARTAKFDWEDRKIVSARNNGLCQICGINHGSEGHHLLPISVGTREFQSKYPGNINDLLSYIANCLWVCSDCGDKVHDPGHYIVDYNQIFVALCMAIEQEIDKINVEVKITSDARIIIRVD